MIFNATVWHECNILDGSAKVATPELRPSNPEMVEATLCQPVLQITDFSTGAELAES